MHMFSVFVRLGDGDFIFVGAREELRQARELTQDLKACWPHEYEIRDSSGDIVDAKQK